MILSGEVDRDKFVSSFGCDQYAFWKNADELGLFPDPILETAKIRATVTRMMSTGGSVNLVDFLPPVMVPDPDPEEDAAKMNAFVGRMSARMS